MDSKANQHITGGVQLRSNLSIVELGNRISENILGGIKLGGLENYIYDEVPAIYGDFLGFRIILQGYSGLEHESGFYLDVIPDFVSDEEVTESIDISNYLIALFKNTFKDDAYIQII